MVNRKYDPTAEEAIKEVAEILAKGYLNLLAKRRQDPTGTAAAETAPSPKPRQPRKQGQPAEIVLPSPPPRSESRAPIPEAARAAIAERLNRLLTLTTKELRAEYEELFGRPPQTTNKQHLFRRIAWEIQAQAEGRLPDAIREYACRIAEQTELYKRVAENLKKRNATTTSAGSHQVEPPRRRPDPRIPKPRDPRLPAPGSMLVLKRGRETARVTVLETGFEYAGQRYRSLSAVARAVAGRSVNAFEFFGLTDQEAVTKPDPTPSPRKG